MTKQEAIEMLSEKERIVFTKVLQGMSNFDIGYDMEIYEPSVKFHLTNIYRKLNVKNRAQMMARYLTPSPIENLADTCHAVKHETGPSGNLDQ
jgi:two-component system nitrate/nitrite response regulator NarP